jgi:hypothetical protein
MDLFGLMNAAQKCAAFFFENVCVEYAKGRTGQRTQSLPYLSGRRALRNGVNEVPQRKSGISLRNLGALRSSAVNPCGPRYLCYYKPLKYL